MSKYDESKRKPFQVHSRRSEMGKTNVTIDCVFCSHSFIAFVWSLPNGKKCPECGALYTRLHAVPLLKPKKGATTVTGMPVRPRPT